MNAYLQKALDTYRDNSQTFIARAIAKDVLTNAGFSDSDIARAVTSGKIESSLYLFAA